MVFWPGHLDADALNQINEARTGRFTDWWSPILDWFWRGLFILHLSPGFVLLATILGVLLSTYEILSNVFRRWASVVMTLVIAIFPPIFGYLGSLQRDAWFAAFTLAGYALAIKAYRGSGTRQTVFALLALLAVWLGMAARQNGVIVLIPVVVIATRFLIPAIGRVISRVINRHPSAHRKEAARSSRFSAAIICSVALLGAFAASQWVLTYDVIHAVKSYPEQATFEGDLANLSVRTGKVLVPTFIFPSQNIATLKAHYSPYGTTWLVVGSDHPLVTGDRSAPFPSLVDGMQEGTLLTDWLHAIEHYPKAYFHVRWKEWTRLIAWSSNSYEPYHPGYDANPWGYKAHFPSLDNFALAYLRRFTYQPLQGGPLFRTWVYLILAVGLGIDLVRRKRRSDIRIIGTLVLSCAVYYSAFFFAAPGLGFRWGWLLVLSTLIALVVDVRDHWRWRVRRMRLRSQGRERTSIVSAACD